MSDSYTNIIPLDEKYIPNKVTIKNLLRVLKNDNLKVTVLEDDEVTFYDCGENFEKIECPFCNKELDIEWWQNEMGKAYEDKFNNLQIITPCCNKQSSLNSLNYNWPQGFAKFAFKIDNISEEFNEILIRFKEISNETWRIIHNHL